MTREEWAFIVSLLAMLAFCSSYFFKKKSIYLCAQGVGIILLILSYLLQHHYFASVGMIIGLIRAVVYLLYEYKNRETPIWWAVGFTLAGIAFYVVVNILILKDTSPADIVYLIGLACYAFIFRIRNFKLVRYLVIIPTVLSIFYNVLIRDIPLCFSYGFELSANVVAIIRYRILDKKRGKQDEKSKDSSVDTLG